MKNTEAKVGAFIVVCAAVLAVTVYFLSKAEFRGKETPYRMYLRYAGGVEPGTTVLFGGISVGRVTSVSSDQADPTRIEISLGVKQGTPLNAKSLGKVGSISLLGSPVVTITTGSNDAPRLPPGAVIPSQETISVDDLQRKVAALADSAQTTLASVNTDVNKITADAHQVLANLNKVTGRTNQEHLAAILSNTNRATAEVSAKVGPTIDNVNQTVTNANQTVTTANQTITSLQQPIQADLTELHETLQTFHGVASSVQSMLSENRENIYYTLENMRLATDNLNDFTRTINQEPWSLVRIKQPEDRNVPQEKSK
jgi:phospholipid/cholesterol/gamma-HCH transport system substrate-binding protein